MRDRVGRIKIRSPAALSETDSGDRAHRGGEGERGPGQDIAHSGVPLGEIDDALG